MDIGDGMKKIAVASVALLLIFILAEQILVKKDDAEKTTVENQDLVEEIEEYGLEIGQKAPDFTLETLDGTMVSLQDVKGKKVLLNFWASWCIPCKEEMPHMQKVYEQYNDQNVEILAINLTFGKETPEDAKAFAEELGLTFPILLDRGGKIGDLYKIIPIPTSYFIDEDGYIRWKYMGPMDEEYIIDQLNRL